jgi:DNA-binding NtrC family response regulator
MDPERPLTHTAGFDPSRVFNVNASDIGWLNCGSGGRAGTLQEVIAKVAPHESSVLIVGEIGCAKCSVLRRIHRGSQRASGPCEEIRAPCDEMSMDLDVRGYVRGAFSGAQEDRKGMLERATGGSFILARLHRMSEDGQLLIADSLESSSIRPLGSRESVPIDIRFMSCATPEVLESPGKVVQYMRRAGGFLILVSPLRSTPEALPALCDVLLSRMEPSKRINREALSMLEKHPWTGNLRELFNTLEGAHMLGKTSTICPSDLEMVWERYR